MNNIKTVTCRIETEKHKITSIKKECVLLIKIPEEGADYIVFIEFSI